MEYIIHGTKVEYNELECGLYKQHSIGWEYAVMAPSHLIDAINKIPRDQAIMAIGQLNERVTQQVKWTDVPKNIGFPILRGGPAPTSLSEVRGNLQNLETFTKEILNALQGK